MSIVQGSPGPFMVLIADGIIWIMRKFGFFKEELKNQEEIESIKEILEEKGFHFNEEH